MANYEHTTREEFRLKVRQKLGESIGVHWTSAELNLCIDEALLTFGAISGFWKDEVIINTQENKVIYNLFEDPVVGIDLVKPSIGYDVVFSWLNKDLMEDLSLLNSASDFLNVDTYIKLIESKYNQFQQLTSLVLAKETYLIPANQNLVAVPEELIDIRRVIFITEDGEQHILDEADEEEVHLYSDALTEISIPRFYSNVYGETKNIRLHPTPSVVGEIEIIYVVGIDSIPLDDETTIINLPNNLLPYIKFGVEADIFANEGVLNDPIRSAYCLRRWEEGITVGRNYTTVLIAKVNEQKHISLDSLDSVDLYSDNVKVRTPPTVLGFGGLNIFRTDVVPSEVEYSIKLLNNSNAKLPANDVDFIRIDLEYIDTLADYVVHLAKFRNGAAEVASTNNLKDNFLKMSVNHNRRLIQAGITFEHLIGITKKQEEDQPRIPVEV